RSVKNSKRSLKICMRRTRISFLLRRTYFVFLLKRHTRVACWKWPDSSRTHSAKAHFKGLAKRPNGKREHLQTEVGKLLPNRPWAGTLASCKVYEIISPDQKMG